MEKPDCTLCFDFDFGLFQASPLCVPSGGRVYQTTFSEWRGDTNRFSIRASLTWFKTQGRLGCVLCSLLAESVAALSFGDDDWERGYYDLFTPSFLVVHGSRRVLLYVDVIRPASVQQYRIHAVPKLPSPHSALVAGYFPFFENEVDLILHNVSRLANECCAEHTLCQQGPTRLPSRVLDVGPPDSSSDPVLRVTNEEYGRYVALSHRWGDVMPLKTTRDTLGMWKKSIPWSAIPKTFSDAIFITRRIGVRYLWIDSLCIIQDDERDWMVESAKMCDIYQGAFLTISALQPESSSDGILLPRPPVLILQRGAGDSRGIAHARETISHDWFIRQTANSVFFSDRRRNDYPILSRAWCFQERLLSTRIAHFAGPEVVWECRSSAACECGTVPPMPLKRCWVGALMFNEGASFQKARFWNTVVASTYCDKSLTYHTDLLVALAGVARRFASPDLGRYLGGLWENCLGYSLLWESEDYLGETTIRRAALLPGAEGYTAPTFTWASRIGPIRWRYIKESGWCQTDRFDDRAPPPLLIDILDVRCDLKSEDPYGKVVGGYLRVSGMLAQGHLVKMERRERDPRSIPLRLAFEVMFPNDDERLELALDSSEDVELASGTTVYCLPVVGSCRRGDRTVGGQYDALVQVGLCLRHTEQNDGNFHRIGVFYASVHQKTLEAAQRREVVIV